MLGVLLAVSLALNVFALGFVAARAWQRPGLERGGRGHEGMFHADQILGETAPRKLQWLSREQRRQLVPRFKALRLARREAEQALRQEPFDRAHFARALEGVRSETGNVQQALHGLLAELADGMTPAQRAELARLNWQERKRHGRGHGKHRRQDGAASGPVRDAGVAPTP
jgi:uncharacterized membrane protein